MHTLFDENGFLNIGDIVASHPAYKTIMEDGIVTEDELKTQADATIASLRRLQQLCSDEQQGLILDAISDMSVLFAVYHNYELQKLR